MCCSSCRRSKFFSKISNIRKFYCRVGYSELTVRRSMRNTVLSRTPKRRQRACMHNSYDSVSLVDGWVALQRASFTWKPSSFQLLEMCGGGGVMRHAARSGHSRVRQRCDEAALRQARNVPVRLEDPRGLGSGAYKTGQEHDRVLSLPRLVGHCFVHFRFRFHSKLVENGCCEIEWSFRRHIKHATIQWLLSMSYYYNRTPVIEQRKSVLRYEVHRTLEYRHCQLFKLVDQVF